VPARSVRGTRSDSRDEQVDLDAEIVVENRLREQRRPSALLLPLKALLPQIALVGKRERPFLAISDDD
jgi:hypothetical protein